MKIILWITIIIVFLINSNCGNIVSFKILLESPLSFIALENDTRSTVLEEVFEYEYSYVCIMYVLCSS